MIWLVAIAIYLIYVGFLIYRHGFRSVLSDIMVIVIVGFIFGLYLDGHIAHGYKWLMDHF